MKKKILLIIITLLCLGGIIFAYTKVEADSGWDSSYDSGGGGWSSDYGGGSDWGSSWDHDYSSGSSYSSDSSSPLGLLVLIIIIVIIIASSGKKNKNNSHYIPATYTDVSDELLAKYGINKEEFKKMVYDKYVAIQNAWMNFDYEKLKDNLTDELYNSYMMQLDALKLKKEKNIMSDFELVEVKIIGITDLNGLFNVKTYLRVCMYDYVVDENNKVLRGTKKYKIDIQYIIDFVREEDNTKKVYCPHCGAEIETVTSGVCSYCRTKIVVPAKDYVMSRKMSVGQGRK